MKTMFPREFVEWQICSMRFLPTIDRDIDDSLIEYHFMDYESNDMKKYSLDDLYKYWLFNVKSMEFKITGQ